MSNTIALAIETMVAVLLTFTIGYCWLLNKRLMKLRADEGALKETISELVTATDIAQRAIAGLRQAVNDCDTDLADRLTRAERVSLDMSDQLRAGEEVVHRITRIAEAARAARAGATEPAPVAVLAPTPRPAPDHRPATRASATLAAAQAFVTRARQRSAGMAA